MNKLAGTIAVLFFVAVHGVYAAVTIPAKSNGSVEITFDSVDEGGNPVAGLTGVDGSAMIFSLGAPGGITTLQGGSYSLELGYFAQDLVAPSAVASFAAGTTGLAGQIGLSWTAPGDNLTGDRLLPGSRFHIASTTVLTDAMNEGFWQHKRDTADIIISTGNINPGDVLRYTVTGLSYGQTYYFRIWTLDQAANWSDLGNPANGQALLRILSVYVVDPSTYDYTEAPTNYSVVAASGVLVRNNGTVNETYFLRISTSLTQPEFSVWSASTTPGNNTYALYAVFASTKPDAANYGDSEGDDILTLTDISASTVNFTYGNKPGGTNIPPFDYQPLLSDTPLWFKLKTPLATSTTGQQVIPVVITATETQ